MKEQFGLAPSGENAFLYTISCGTVTAKITDYGATLVRLYAPDRNGALDDVVLGYESAQEYAEKPGYLGGTIGRNSNRIKNGRFMLDGKTIQMGLNDSSNSLHGGPDGLNFRIWQVESHMENSITFRIESPDGDQGLPGNADIRVTYTLTAPGDLTIAYDGICDKATVFNMTNHSYFNLAGHQNTMRAMEQTLMMPGRVFTVADEESIPTGELRSVENSPMDFRTPKPIGRDIEADYAPLHLQSGYDHNFEAYGSPCAVLSDEPSGRVMEVYTDCPGIQFYSGNYLENEGKDGVFYHKRAGLALETQFYPNSVNEPQWKQPFTPANTPYHSETTYRFFAK